MKRECINTFLEGRGGRSQKESNGPSKIMGKIEMLALEKAVIPNTYSSWYGVRRQHKAEININEALGISSSSINKGQVKEYLDDLNIYDSEEPAHILWKTSSFFKN